MRPLFLQVRYLVGSREGFGGRAPGAVSRACTEIAFPGRLMTDSRGLGTYQREQTSCTLSDQQEAVACVFFFPSSIYLKTSTLKHFHKNSKLEVLIAFGHTALKDMLCLSLLVHFVAFKV